MRNAPLISVVVTCFNQGRVLEHALRSIASSLPAEIVVIDDGCTDETPELLARFETPLPFRTIQQRSRTGRAAARNRGLRESRGDYIVFLDAGDRLLPGALDVGASTLGEHPECAFVFGRCVPMNRNGAALPVSSQPRIVRDHYRELLRHNYIGDPAAAMFRRTVLERAGGFNPGLNGAADYELYLHVARHYPVYDHAAVVAHCGEDEPVAHAAAMLRETLEVLWSQRPFLEADEASLAACREGQRRWQDRYGTQLADEIRTALRRHEWIAAMTKSAVLAEYHPRGLWHHVARKGLRMVKDLEPEPRPSGVKASATNL